MILHVSMLNIELSLFLFLFLYHFLSVVPTHAQTHKCRVLTKTRKLKKVKGSAFKRKYSNPTNQAKMIGVLAEQSKKFNDRYNC